MPHSRETDIEPEGGLTIDCDHCALQATDACDDCVVSFLLGREPDDAVVIDADEARAMRMLGAGRPRARRCASATGPADDSGRWRVKRHLLVTNDFPPKVGGIQNYLWELWSRLDPASFVVLTARSDDERRRLRRRAGRPRRAHRTGAWLDPLLPVAQTRWDIDALRAHPWDRPRAPRPRPAARSARPAPRRALRRHPARRRGHGARAGCPARAPLLARRSAGARSSSFRPAATRPRRPAGPSASAGLAATFVEIPPGVDTSAVGPARGDRASSARAALGLPATGAAGGQRQPAGARARGWTC